MLRRPVRFWGSTGKLNSTTPTENPWAAVQRTTSKLTAIHRLRRLNLCNLWLGSGSHELDQLQIFKESRECSIDGCEYIAVFRRKNAIRFLRRRHFEGVVPLIVRRSRQHHIRRTD